MNPSPAPILAPNEAQAALAAGAAVLVDVREPTEWRDGVALPAFLLPLSDLQGSRTYWRPFLEVQRGKRILLYCKAGGRAGIAAALLKCEGFDTANVGGYTAWVAGGLPVRQAPESGGLAPSRS
jgi:rhodanese-related sulfurtransferase